MTSPQMILDCGIVQVVGIVPTLILAQVGLGRTAQDTEVDSSVRRPGIGTNQIDSNNNNSKPSTIRSISDGSFSGTKITLDNSGSSYDGSPSEKVVRNGTRLLSPFKGAFVVQGQSHDLYHLEGRDQVDDQVQGRHDTMHSEQGVEVDITEV